MHYFGPKYHLYSNTDTITTLSNCDLNTLIVVHHGRAHILKTVTFYSQYCFFTQLQYMFLFLEISKMSQKFSHKPENLFCPCCLFLTPAPAVTSEVLKPAQLTCFYTTVTSTQTASRVKQACNRSTGFHWRFDAAKLSALGRLKGLLCNRVTTKPNSIFTSASFFSCSLASQPWVTLCRSSSLESG